MARANRANSGSFDENALEDSEYLRHRFDSRRELRAGRDAVSAGNRDGGDVESGAGFKSAGNYGDGNARRRNSLELFAGFGHRAAAALGAFLGNFRRRPISGFRAGSVVRARSGRHGRFGRKARRRVLKTLYGL